MLTMAPVRPVRPVMYLVIPVGRSGSFRVTVGVITSLVTDTENETVLTAP